MSRSPSHSESIRTLKKQCKESNLRIGEHVLILSSPLPEATLATAIVCRALQRKGILYHIKFVDTLVESKQINALRKSHSSSTVLMVGTNIVSRKRIAKGKSYPCLIGTETQFEQELPSIGSINSVSAAAYIFSEIYLEVNNSDLQIAAMGSLTQSNAEVQISKATQTILDRARKEGIVEERRGLKFFGTNFLPINQTLQFSIYPYLQGLSGEPKSCEKLFNAADIPLTKRSSPISSLTTREVQNLNEQLIQNDSQNKTSVIQKALGTDFVFTLEDKSSPIHYLSGVYPLALTAWNRWTLGMSTAVWIGDRARTMEEFVSTFKDHSSNVISSLKRINPLFQGNELESDSICLTNRDPIVGIPIEMLTDVCRILFETGTIEKEEIIALHTENSMIISWRLGKFDSYSVFERMRKITNKLKLTSRRSLQLFGLSSSTSKEALKLLDNLIEAK